VKTKLVIHLRRHLSDQVLGLVAYNEGADLVGPDEVPPLDRFPETPAEDPYDEKRPIEEMPPASRSPFDAEKPRNPGSPFETDPRRSPFDTDARTPALPGNPGSPFDRDPRGRPFDTDVRTPPLPVQPPLVKAERSPEQEMPAVFRDAVEAALSLIRPIPAPRMTARPEVPTAPPSWTKSPYPRVESEGYYHKEPAASDRIYVDISQYESTYYFIQGDVARPGRLAFTGRDSVLDAINYAGGLRTSVELNTITLARPARGDQSAREYRIDFPAILKGDQLANLQLFPGDRLNVSSK
jgi:hypothetical protein